MVSRIYKKVFKQKFSQNSVVLNKLRELELCLNLSKINSGDHQKLLSSLILKLINLQKIAR
jgi:hypothetical protein